jgi:hypothetical protein
MNDLIYRSDVHLTHRFHIWQVWPGSYSNPPASDTMYPFPPVQDLAITRNTRIASMGSCFAREIKKVLIERGYHYIQEECEHPAAVHASAAWERVYNTFCIRQIFEYTFADWHPDVRWWCAPYSEIIQDPYRRIILYDTLDEAEADFRAHRLASRRAIETAEVLILTLGLTEIWEDKVDGSVLCLPSGPYITERGDMTRYRYRVSRYGENLKNLERIYHLLSIHNPRCKLILTISPVHLWATFRNDLDVISASWNSKATLRAVIDEFVADHPDVYYFPAFEMAVTYRMILGKSMFTQDREPFHVNQETIAFIMDNFFRFYRPSEQ